MFYSLAAERRQSAPPATSGFVKVRVMTLYSVSKNWRHNASIDLGVAASQPPMKLALSDGTVFSGQSFVALREARGRGGFQCRYGWIRGDPH
jgi:hypothetical protein